MLNKMKCECVPGFRMFYSDKSRAAITGICSPGVSLQANVSKALMGHCVTLPFRDSIVQLQSHYTRGFAVNNNR